MNDGPKKLNTGYLVEGLELYIRKIAYTKYDATVLVLWSNYNIVVTRQMIGLVYLQRWRVYDL
jgi:hypothetical protein